MLLFLSSPGLSFLLFLESQELEFLFLDHLTFSLPSFSLHISKLRFSWFGPSVSLFAFFAFDFVPVVYETSDMLSQTVHSGFRIRGYVPFGPIVHLGSCIP